MTLLDIGPPTGSSERKPYHDWKKGNWYDGGDKTATLEDLYVFYEDILQPRSGYEQRGNRSAVDRENNHLTEVPHRK